MSKLSRKKKAAATSTAFAPRDKAMLIGLLILLLAIPALVLHFSSIRQQTASISRTVTKWKTTYHINDAQAELIQQIELDFHGNGSPFSIKPTRSKEEKHRHHEEISRLMSPEDGARFMKSMEKSEGSHWQILTQPASTDIITATAEAPSGKAKMAFEAKDGKLISTTKLPEGEGYQVVVQAKATPHAKTKNFRIKLLLYTCKECSNPEYACTCADH